MSTAVKLRRSSHSTLADLHRDRECGRPSDRSHFLDYPDKKINELGARDWRDRTRWCCRPIYCLCVFVML